MPATEMHEEIELGPIDASVEAALQLEEMKQGRRATAPALHTFLELLRTPPQAYAGDGISMLADVRAFPVFRESLGQMSSEVRASGHEEMAKIVERLLSNLEEGVANSDLAMVEAAKQFCTAFNSSLIAKQMSDLYTRREKSDARYISHESVP